MWGQTLYSKEEELRKHRESLEEMVKERTAELRARGQELEIKTSKPTKDIAEIMNLSKRTIDSYRENIRGKLGLKNKKTNLRTHLLSV